MEKDKEKKLEEKIERNTKHIWWLTIVMVVLLVAAALGGYLAGASRIANEVVEQKEAVQEEKSTGPLELTDAVKTRLDKFVNVASKPNYTGGGTIDDFMGGLTSLTNEIKYKMTNVAVYQDNKVERDKSISTEEANRLTGLKPDANELVDKVKVADFDSTYKELFNENPSYTLDDLKGGCPSPAAMDTENKVLYYFHRCGGSGPEYNIKIASHDSDTDYYYVHEEITVSGTTTKLLWKFDKDFNFVSTSVE